MEEQAGMAQLMADPGFLLSRVGAAVRAGFKDVLAGWGIRPQQYLILLILDARGGTSQQELCTAARIDSGNMVELLDGLEALRYAQRARDPHDRRRQGTIRPGGPRKAMGSSPGRDQPGPAAPSQAKAEAGTGSGLAGTSVATETCGQVRPLKFSSTCCEYWICVALTVTERGALMATGGFTENSGTGCPAAPVFAGMISGGWPGSKVGTSMVNSTVSIQKTACLLTASAFGSLAVGLPRRKAMFWVPPPNSGAAGWVAMTITVVDVMVCDAMWLRRNVLGSSSMACVIVPASTNDVRSCGMRAVSLSDAIWLGNWTLLFGWPIVNGVMFTAAISGLPSMMDEVPWASIVVPCGIDAMRVTVGPSRGSVVAGMAIQSPGSKWMPTGWRGTVTSLITCR